MMSVFQDSVFFGVLLSLASYSIGLALKIKTGWSLMNPLLISIVLVIVVLLITGVSYSSYNASANCISFLLTPATICLAVPLYQQVELLKRNYKAVLIGISSGVLASLCSVLILAILFHFDHAAYVTFLPKSITTAIGIGVAEELGGHVSVSVVVIIITGVLGNIFAEVFLKLLRIRRTNCQGYSHRLFVSCTWYSQGHGNGNDRRSYEQPLYCGMWCDDRYRRFYLCLVLVGLVGGEYTKGTFGVHYFLNSLNFSHVKWHKAIRWEFFRYIDNEKD